MAQLAFPEMVSGRSNATRSYMTLAGDADFQSGHGITPLSRNTASTIVPKIGEQSRRIRALFPCRPTFAQPKQHQDIADRR
jgi:hypothetical protein